MTADFAIEFAMDDTVGPLGRRLTIFHKGQPVVMLKGDYSEIHTSGFYVVGEMVKLANRGGEAAQLLYLAYKALDAIQRLGYPLDDNWPTIADEAYEGIGIFLWPDPGTER